jgi:hypothetical protein
LISVAFTALLQTLKVDPQMVKQMVKLIQNIPIINDRKHDKDNDNYNVIKYLESNKDNILDLAEKHYENLVEALTNKSIDSAAASNPALPLS